MRPASWADVVDAHQVRGHRDETRDRCIRPRCCCRDYVMLLTLGWTPYGTADESADTDELD